jgi:cobalt/nickel transport system permease protein
MTHMHIPDGILPVSVWLSGFVLMALALSLCLLRLRNADLKKKIPLLGAVSAVMLIAMSLEILPLAYHINLSVVAGILLGPALGFLAAFMTNVILALMGHGGITVIGLNTLLLGSEAVLGHLVFYFLPKVLPVFWRTFLATLVTLCIATFALIGIVALSHVDPALFSYEEHAGEHGVAPKETIAVSRFATMVLTFGFFGWLLEAAVSGAVIAFIAKVKPDLLGHVLHREQQRSEGRTTP